jgi:hypothetical protein
MKKERSFKITCCLMFLAIAFLAAWAGDASAAYLVDPIAHWKMEEAAADWLDNTTNNYDLECSGGCPAQTTGRIGYGLFFNNTLTPKPALRTKAGAVNGALFNWAYDQDFSIEFWFKRAPAATTPFPDVTEVFISRNDSSGVTSLRWSVSINSTGNVLAVFRAVDGAGAGISLSSTGTYADNQWHHVAVVRNAQGGAAGADIIELYVDGQYEDSISPTYNSGKGFASNTVELRLGEMDLAPWYEFGGSMDSVALYTQTLSSSVIASHYNAGLAEKDYDESFAPVVLAADPAIAYVGYTYTQQVEAGGNPLPLTYSLGTNAPSGMTIDANTGLIQWTPASNQPGSVTFSVNATNTEGSGNRNFTINVSDFCNNATTAYWHFDEETAATNFVEAINGKNGTGTGGLTKVTGTLDDAQRFSNTTNTNVITVASDGSGSDIFDWSGNFTIQVWVNRTLNAATEVFLGRNHSGGLQWWFGFNDSGKAQFHLRDSTGNAATVEDVVSSTTVADGDWHQVTVVYDDNGSKLYLYVDAVQEDMEETAFTGTFASTSAPVIVGNLSSGGSFAYNGALDELLLTARTLDVDMISAMYDRRESDNKGLCNADPTITSNAGNSSKVGVQYTYSPSVSNPEGDTLAWTVINAPSGLTVNPATGAVTWTPANATSVSFTLVVSDGFGGQDTETISLTPVPANSAPQVTGQQAVSVTEGQSVTIEISMLTVTDPDGNPLTLTVLAGSNYTKNGNAITPVSGYTGTLTVPVQISDGTASVDYNMNVTVNPDTSQPQDPDDDDNPPNETNSPPQVTAQQDVSVTAGQSITLELSMLTVTDSDGDALTLTVQAGSNYTVASNTITPDSGFTGTLTVPVKISDGTDTVDYSMTVSVTAEEIPASTGGGDSGGGCFIGSASFNGGNGTLTVFAILMMALSGVGVIISEKK